MRRVRDAPVAVRVAAVSALVLALAVGIGVIAFRSALQRSQLQGLDQSIDAQVTSLRELAAEGAIPIRIPTERDSPLFCQIISKSGKVLGASANVSDMELMVDADSPVMTQGEVRRTKAQIDGVDVRLTKVGVTTTTGPSWILVAAPMKNLRDAEASLLRQLRVGGPLLVFLGTLGIGLVARRALRPVDELRRQVDAISSIDLTERVSEPRSNDEVGRLARTMNGLLGRVQESHDRQSRFVGDASHELRSPLATVRTRLEVALRAPDSTDWKSVAEASLRQTSRMERLVDDLLMLARTDTAGAAPTMTVDLDELISEEISYLRTVSRVAIDTTQVSAGRVLGHPDELRRVIVNLASNAIRHATSTVQLGLRTTGSNVELFVDDDGPGVPDAERDRIFDRFTQLDASRARVGTAGAGLGLAIVADVMRRHQGTVAVTHSPLGGARFTVTLPSTT
jgi:signal transduction histidine kinase